MKDLFIILGDKLQARNFEEGPISYQKLKAEHVAELVHETKSAGKRVLASFDWPAVPSEKSDRDLRGILQAFEAQTGIRLTMEELSLDHEGEVHPVLNFMASISATSRVLVVEYFYELASGQSDDAAIIDRFKISQDSLVFHSFEKG